MAASRDKVFVGDYENKRLQEGSEIAVIWNYAHESLSVIASPATLFFLPRASPLGPHPPKSGRPTPNASISSILVLDFCLSGHGLLTTLCFDSGEDGGSSFSDGIWHMQCIRLPCASYAFWPHDIL